MDTSKKNPPPDDAAQLARESRERVAAAWVELIEAAKSEPKARAFLEAFAAEAVKAVAVAQKAVLAGAGDGS